MLKKFLVLFSLLCCMLHAGAVSPSKLVTVTGMVGKHNYVDLGLKSGTKWAVCNVGAPNLLQYGYPFAWGEKISSKDFYDWSSYKWIDEKKGVVKKYITSYTYGLVDTFRVLTPSDDVASAKWGKLWRMPTMEEMQELVDGCYWRWTYNFKGSGIAGRIGTSKTNGNTIFFPAGGARGTREPKDAGAYGLYWTSSVYTYGSLCAYSFDFDASSVGVNYDFRFVGRYVRPVVR